MKSNKFIIVAPPYSERSGGIMVLHDLCEALNRGGYEAGIVFLHGGNATEQNFQYAFSNDPTLYRHNGNYHYFKDESEIREVISTGTVIYPDLITKNPLGARNTVRYILNFNSHEFPGDFIISYSKIYSRFTDFILSKPFHDPSFTDIGTAAWSKRTLDLTYIGKGANFTQCHRIKNTILVERDYPRDKEQLALLLKQCRFFFTWDCVSATNFDAMMCGAIPILLHDKQIPRQDINLMEIGAFPRINFSSIEELPKGLEYRKEEVDADVMAFKKSYYNLINDWDALVIDFAKIYLSLASTTSDSQLDLHQSSSSNV
jgi:hypothetical protein